MAHDPTRPAPSPASAVEARPDPLRPPAGDPSTLADAFAPGAEPLEAATAPALGPDCWFLSGPTAAGKSDLAVELARKLGAEVLSVDSMAVYRGLDVGTAKPTADQRRAVPHHLLDLVPPAEPFSVARWLAVAAAAVADVRGRGRRVLFVGGTPLYLRALRDGLATLPAADPGLRAALVAEAGARGPAALHGRLAEIDPAAAARIHPHDLKRIVRALEVARATGRPLSAAFAPLPHPVFASQLLVVDLPRRLLRERIDRRVEKMFSGGLVEETAAALAAPGGIGPTARQAAGYAEALDLLAGRIDRAEAIRRTQARTRQLAKRQLTWLRSFPRAIWVSA
jgi:tRNA dimethylallyltransferase